MPTLSLVCLFSLATSEDCLSYVSQADRGPHTHLTPRDIGAGGTTVFGVVIAIGFAGLVLICGLSSRAYRRVAQQQQYMVIVGGQLESTSSDEPMESPQLWDLLVEEDAKQRVWEWDRELPMSARLELSEPADNRKVSPSNENSPRKRRDKVREVIELKPIVESSGSVDVAILIAMPSPQTSALIPDWRSDEKVRFGDEDEELWSRYTIGTTRVGYVGD